MQSIIVLHGRGSSGEKFGLELLKTSIPDYGCLQESFPDAKFIFPTAAKRRAQIYKRSWIHQWFDNWSLQTPTKREELQFDGLRESTQYVHALLEEEFAFVGARNVVLWGLSQGSAASMIASLLWQGEPYAAAIGMCGWLPLRKRIMDTLSEDDNSDLADDPFGHEDGDPNITSAVDDATTNIKKAVEYLQEELEMSLGTSSSDMTNIPTFLGHGTEDDRVPPALGKEAVELLRALEVEVEFKDYVGLGHWYSGQMLHDIVNFIRVQAKWPVSIAAPED